MVTLFKCELLIYFKRIWLNNANSRKVLGALPEISATQFVVFGADLFHTPANSFTFSFFIAVALDDFNADITFSTHQQYGLLPNSGLIF
jgi:hypothetical protein